MKRGEVEEEEEAGNQEEGNQDRAESNGLGVDEGRDTTRERVEGVGQVRVANGLVGWRVQRGVIMSEGDRLHICTN